MTIHFLVAQIINTTSLPNVPADQKGIDNILSMVFGVIGSISLLMIAIGGFRYILARGEPSSVSQAKNTILYAIIGLVISLTAYAIINFVVGNVA